MALQPSKYNGQERLQPGARGETFQANMPGFRDESADRVNRTNNKLATNAHDVPNIKYEFDRRLPVLFKYGFAYGYNQIVIPKGRIVAADPYMDSVDFDMHKAHNTLTLANGGAPVKLRLVTDTYRDDSGKATALVSAAKQGLAVSGAGKEWIPVVGMTAAYTELTYKPFAGANGGPLAQLTAGGYEVDSTTGKVIVTATGVAADVRAGNHPLGVLQRNEYTRNDDAYNGIMPGAVLTDAMVELPWFAYKDNAENNPWGSAYGGLFPGALVKSDENGRFVVSPLSFPESEMTGMGIAEYELERQQVIGQVYSVNNDLIPEGAAKWATWALSDRLKFNEFNPDLYRQNNRDGEDTINNSAYNSTGKYPGYPYDRTIGENDLNMLASTARSFSNRMSPEYQYENLGIPGLTDGANVASRAYDPETIGKISYAGGNEYVEMFFRTAEINLETGTLQVSVADGAFANCVEGAALTAKYTAIPAITAVGSVVELEATPHLPEGVVFAEATDEQKIAAQNAHITAENAAAAAAATFLTVKFANLLQGIIVLTVSNKAKADTYLQAHANSITLKAKYSKRGLAGVPTFLDWDGCVGSVKVLLTK